MRQFLVVTGLALVLACTAIIEFVLLLFHHGFTWAFVVAITCLLYASAWFRPTPVLSPINLLMAACIGAALGIEALFWGSPALAALQFTIGFGVTLAGAMLIQRLSTANHKIVAVS